MLLAAGAGGAATVGILQPNTRSNVEVAKCHIQVHLSEKLHPCGDATSEPYKPAFHGGHLSRNTSYGGAATLQIFRLPWRRYSYLL